ncbi:unnamed protein product [Rhizophagus irregularis]|nr:unnamed protein product [Rhizophagus irregularis]
MAQDTISKAQDTHLEGWTPILKSCTAWTGFKMALRVSLDTVLFLFFRRIWNVGSRRLLGSFDMMMLVLRLFGRENSV